jgi:hypothetical protein
MQTTSEEANVKQRKIRTRFCAPNCPCPFSCILADSFIPFIAVAVPAYSFLSPSLKYHFLKREKKKKSHAPHQDIKGWIAART